MITRRTDYNSRMCILGSSTQMKFSDAGGDRELSVREKLRVCFASVALPALQASTSTNLCVLGLLFIPLYMAQVNL